MFLLKQVKEFYSIELMGFDTDVRKQTEAKTTCKRTTPLPAQLGPVAHEDVLTRLFMAKGANDYQFTGEELFEYFFRPIRQRLLFSPASVYIATCDNPKGVPPEKAETQAERSKTSTVVPYPDTWTVGNPGMFNDAGGVELIDIRRLMRTRASRIKLWTYLDLMVRRKFVMPRGKLFVFNYQNPGPFVHSFDGYTQRTDWFHNLGEADLSGPFFYWLFRKSHIEVITTDTDWMAIAMAYFSQVPKQMHPIGITISYHVRGQSAPVQLDLHRLYAELEGAFKMTPEQFVLACILTGSDYNKKKPVSHYFNAKAIVAAVAATKPQIVNGSITMLDLVRFNRQLFTTKFKENGLNAIPPASPILASEAESKWIVASKKQTMLRDLLWENVEGGDESVAMLEDVTNKVDNAFIKALKRHEGEHAITRERKRKLDDVETDLDRRVTELLMAPTAKRTKTIGADGDAETIDDTIDFELEYKTTASWAYHEADPELVARDQIEYVLNAKGYSKHVIPTEEEFEDRLRLINFNLAYWLNSWKKWTLDSVWRDPFDPMLSASECVQPPL